MAFGDYRVELGGWTWDRSEAVGAKAPTGPPVIRLDKKLIKTTRCSSVRYDVNLLLVGDLGGGHVAGQMAAIVQRCVDPNHVVSSPCILCVV